jgi:hypothetical protein
MISAASSEVQSCTRPVSGTTWGSWAKSAKGGIAQDVPEDLIATKVFDELIAKSASRCNYKHATGWHFQEVRCGHRDRRLTAPGWDADHSWNGRGEAPVHRDRPKGAELRRSPARTRRPEETKVSPSIFEVRQRANTSTFVLLMRV